MKVTTNNCLKVVRDLAKRNEPITSLALVEAMDIQKTERSTALDIAAGWISTLRRYGFLKALAGERVQGPHRQLKVYEITKWGKNYKKAKREEPT
jgi:hypothetical protein